MTASLKFRFRAPLHVEQWRLPQLVSPTGGKNTVLWCGYTWQYWLTTRSVQPASTGSSGSATVYRATA